MKNTHPWCFTGLGWICLILGAITIAWPRVAVADASPPLPDLLLESIQLSPASPLPNQPFSLTVTVRNTGSAVLTRGVYLYLWVDPSVTFPLTTTPRYDDTFIPSLAISGTFQWSQMGMTFITGTHTIYAWVDPTDRVAEEHEQNNTQVVTLTVGNNAVSPPDDFEVDDTCADARPIEVNGAAQSHNFHTAADSDVVYFHARAGITYTIAIFNDGAHADAKAYLYNECPAPVVFGDRSYVYIPVQDETVWVQMFHRTGMVVGDTAYRVRVTASSLAMAEWTALIYLNGDNNLAPYAARARRELETMTPLANTHVLLLYDGNNANDGDTIQYLVQQGGRYQEGINRWYKGELNMGDGNVLRDFLMWGMDAFPARHYYVAIADHGLGVSGISFDETSASIVGGRRIVDRITPSEMRRAIADATLDGARPIDVLHYDGCLMAMLENAWQVRDYVRYLVFSQNVGWSLFGYADYLPRFTSDPRATAVMVAQRYRDLLTEPTVYPLTISVVDTARLPPIVVAVNNLAAAISVTLAVNREAILDARDASQLFDSNGSLSIDHSDDYADLLDFTRQISVFVPTANVRAAAAVLVGVLTDPGASAIVFNAQVSGDFDYGGPHTYILTRASGLSIYFPYTATGKAEYTLYLSHGEILMNEAAGWDEFLQRLFSIGPLPFGDIYEPAPIALVPRRPQAFFPYIAR